jgi:hypothetical protein
MAFIEIIIKFVISYLTDIRNFVILAKFQLGTKVRKKPARVNVKKDLFVRAHK